MESSNIESKIDLFTFREKLDLAKSKFFKDSWNSQEEYAHLPPSSWPIYVVRCETSEEMSLARLVQPKYAKVIYLFVGDLNEP